RDGTIDLEAVANDSWILQQGALLLSVVPCDPPCSEAIKDFAIARTLAQNRDPAQTGLRALKNPKLKKCVVIVNPHAPLVVMVGNVPFIAACPRTTNQRFLLGDGHLYLPDWASKREGFLS